MKKEARKAIFKAKQKNAAPPKDLRQLSDLDSITENELNVFKILGIHTVRDLKKHQAETLFQELCLLTNQSQNLDIQDIFQAAIEQAKNPKLVGQKKTSAYWRKIRIEKETKVKK